MTSAGVLAMVALSAVVKDSPLLDTLLPTLSGYISAAVALYVMGYAAGALTKYFIKRGEELQKAPASLISGVLEVVMSKKHFERVIEPVIADWHEEYFEEIDGQGRRAKLFFMRLRYLYRLTFEVVGSGIIERIRKVVKGVSKAQ